MTNSKFYNYDYHEMKGGWKANVPVVERVVLKEKDFVNFKVLYLPVQEFSSTSCLHSYLQSSARIFVKVLSKIFISHKSVKDFETSLCERTSYI